VFGIVSVTAKNSLISIHIVSIGALSASMVHPREVFKRLVLDNASRFIVFHNHPSGYAAPSPDDFSVTRRLKECGELMGIELLDHIIISDRVDDVYSMKGMGELY